MPLVRTWRLSSRIGVDSGGEGLSAASLAVGAGVAALGLEATETKNPVPR